MDPHDFLDVARQLAAEAGPAHSRSAISRAYYAVYHVAFDLLRSLGIEIERGHGAHEAVQDYLSNSSVDAAIHAGAQLRRFQHLRVKADYWMRDPQPERDAVVASWLQNADRLITSLDAVAMDVDIQQRMIRAIQIWDKARYRPQS